MSASTVELPAGTIEYSDTDGNEPIAVLLHGLLMGASLSDEVIDPLSADHRCVAPTLPLGAHRHPMKPGADLSFPGTAAMVTEFLDRLGLQDVILAGNDTGGALAQLVIAGGAPCVGRVVLASCEAFDNFPPGLTGKTLALAGKLPPWLFGLVMQQMRIRTLRRLPIAFEWLTKHGDATTARWLKPVLTQSGIRRDTVRMLLTIFADKYLLAAAARKLPSFHRPALIVWAASDRVMPPSHGRRLAELIPQARLAEIDDSYTLLPLDQPARLAQLITEFTHASSTTLTTPDDTDVTVGVDAFNSTIQQRPNAAVRAAAEADVVENVRFAHAEGMSRSMRSDGAPSARRHTVGTTRLAGSPDRLRPSAPAGHPHVGSPIATCDFELKSFTTLHGEPS